MLWQGDLLKKVHRCPLRACQHRYATRTAIERHLELAHSADLAALEINSLVKSIACRLKRHTRPVDCPYHDCDDEFADVLDLDDHLAIDGPAAKRHARAAGGDVITIRFLRPSERRKILKRREEQRLAEEAAEAEAEREVCVLSFSSEETVHKQTIDLAQIEDRSPKAESKLKRSLWQRQILNRLSFATSSAVHG